MPPSDPRSACSPSAPTSRCPPTSPASPTFHAAVPDPADHEPIRAQVPLGRLGRAEDVAETVAFLLSERSSYITGQDLVIDGGLVPAFPSLTG
ncbi:SDR family oxidoreductase [Kitasatospora aureofaciens]|uniref:SDR family oxidoreductase n=1 Tax=Kitasatospora aureofaciens TaxID=1894 RepID=A0A1E7MX22_KITAU|nr:SDR family oxidoreductase [Kitasatospora aureofaciens]ARF81377.1 hypothetical protein B6264_22900 [Kitasatospora aureofaciens]OEV32964.1 hypothetical protein HS99_0013870 [Kitasatospora aureofaciens]GGU54859.1 hypothetical protein GCM10010502_01260 [Kitasatospora aureofaciens]